MFSTIYRETYKSYLKIDFPRIPFPADFDLFMEMAQWGKKLVDLHLLKSPELEKNFSRFAIPGDCRVEKIRWEPPPPGEAGETAAGRVYINNKQYFSGISREMWEYNLCGYPAMSKGLKDRRGRILSCEDVKHYIRIAGAVRLTLRCQQEIDRLYLLVEKHLIFNSDV